MVLIKIKPVILVGGKSSRFGKDKIFLKLNDLSILKRTYDLLEKVFDSQPLLVGRKEPILNSETIPDEIEGIGPIAGLYTALKNTNGDFVFLTACDMPFLKESLIRYMILSLDESCDILMPRYDNGMIEPLFSIYNKRVLKYIKVNIETRKYGFRFLLNYNQELKIKFVNENDLKRLDPKLLTFFNINTKSDFEKAGEFLKYEKD
jgi:molybdopterin-guanine dinucleotide biosynthesis protein A